MRGRKMKQGDLYLEDGCALQLLQNDGDRDNSLESEFMKESSFNVSTSYHPLRVKLAFKPKYPTLKFRIPYAKRNVAQSVDVDQAELHSAKKGYKIESPHKQTMLNILNDKRGSMNDFNVLNNFI